MIRKSERRCPWSGDSPQMIAYHDQEWGVPVFDPSKLFELLILEGAQAGLSWSTVLAKRENYRKAFLAFDPARVARISGAKLERLLQDPGIIRNRAKVASTVSNAKAYLELEKTEGAVEFLWQFVSGRPKRNRWRTMAAVPAQTEQSVAMSKALKILGFKFVGPTICYAFMQSAGMVNDHLTTCFRHDEIATSDKKPI